MGRYSTLLAPQLADLAGVEAGQRVLDVGCGPGALTSVLVERVGASQVSAVDPSEQFVAAARERHPGVDVHRANAEELPFADSRFDSALAQLVVHFMTDPVRGLAEMARVTRRGGVVAASVWDNAGEQTPLAPFWRTVREFHPTAADESDRPRRPPRRALRRGRPTRRRGHCSPASGGARELRRMVGALHPRRGARRLLPGGARPGATGRAAGALQAAGRSHAVHVCDASVGSTRRGLVSYRSPSG